MTKTTGTRRQSVSERTVKHDTIVMERKFKSSPAKVFAAWKDPEAYADGTGRGKTG
jgi:hypothetical protein